MAAPLDRTWYNTLIDDDGSGNTGTVWNKSAVDSLLDSVDASLAGVVANPSPVDIGISKLRPRLVMAITNVVSAKARVLGYGGGAGGVLPRAYLSSNESIDDGGGGFLRDDPGLPASGVLCFDGAVTINQTTAAGVRTGLFTFQPDGTFALAGGRIQFPATQNPSADTYTLDDYREGYFTPYWLGTSGQSGITYTVQEGNYTKVGRLVTCFGRIYVATVGTISGQIGIAGLPFAAQVSVYHAGGGIVTAGAFGGPGFSQLVGDVAAGSQVCYLQYVPAGGSTALQPAMQNFIVPGTDVFFQITYHAAN